MFGAIFAAAGRPYPVLETRIDYVDLTEDSPPCSPVAVPPAEGYAPGSPVYSLPPTSPALSSSPATQASVLRISMERDAHAELLDCDDGTYELRGTNTSIVLNADNQLVCSRLADTNDCRVVVQPTRLHLRMATDSTLRLCSLPECRLQGSLYGSAVLRGSDAASINFQQFGSSKCEGFEVAQLVRLVDRTGCVHGDIKYLRSDNVRRFIYQCSALADPDELCAGDKCAAAAHHRASTGVIARPIAAVRPADDPAPPPKRVRQTKRTDNEELEEVLDELHDKTMALREILSLRNDNFLLDHDDQELLIEPARPDNLDNNERSRFRRARAKYEAAVQSLRERQAEQLCTREDVLTSVVNLATLPAQSDVRRCRQWDSYLQAPAAHRDDADWPRVPACMVCGGPADVAFECGHARLCMSDYTQLVTSTQRDAVRPCPDCRQPVNRVIKLFF